MNLNRRGLSGTLTNRRMQPMSSWSYSTLKFCRICFTTNGIDIIQQDLRGLTHKWYLDGQLPHFQFGQSPSDAHPLPETEWQHSVGMMRALQRMTFDPALRNKPIRILEMFLLHPSKRMEGNNNRLHVNISRKNFIIINSTNNHEHKSIRWQHVCGLPFF